MRPFVEAKGRVFEGCASSDASASVVAAAGCGGGARRQQGLRRLQRLRTPAPPARVLLLLLPLRQPVTRADGRRRRVPFVRRQLQLRQAAAAAFAAAAASIATAAAALGRRRGATCSRRASRVVWGRGGGEGRARVRRCVWERESIGCSAVCAAWGDLPNLRLLEISTTYTPSRMSLRAA